MCRYSQIFLGDKATHKFVETKGPALTVIMGCVGRWLTENVKIELAGKLDPYYDTLVPPLSM